MQFCYSQIVVSMSVGPELFSQPSSFENFVFTDGSLTLFPGIKKCVLMSHLEQVSGIHYDTLFNL